MSLIAGTGRVSLEIWRQGTRETPTLPAIGDFHGFSKYFCVSFEYSLFKKKTKLVELM